jgi:uncharacterized protein
MQRALRHLALLALFFATVLAFAQELQQVPPLKAQVTDLAGVLDAGARSELENRLAAIEAASGSQVAILTMSTTRPEDIASYSIRVTDAWQLGRKGVDDGVLVLLAVADREVRIEVGRGLEGAIPDAIAKRIVEEAMTPRFRAGDLAGGLAAGVELIAKRIAGEPLPPPQRTARQREHGGLGGYLGVVFVAALVLGGLMRAIFGRVLGAGIAAGLVGGGVWLLSGALLIGLVAALIAFVFVAGQGHGGGPWIGGGRSGGWSGGGSSGGWSGGGGSFGGGGASGRW